MQVDTAFFQNDTTNTTFNYTRMFDNTYHPIVNHVVVLRLVVIHITNQLLPATSDVFMNCIKREPSLTSRLNTIPTGIGNPMQLNLVLRGGIEPLLTNVKGWCPNR